jgi:hypothetical protein
MLQLRFLCRMKKPMKWTKNSDLVFEANACNMYIYLSYINNKVMISVFKKFLIITIVY